MRRHAVATVAGAAALLALGAHAQTVYRSVGPDGRVSYSDRPPVGAAPASSQSSTSTPESGALPAQLRQASARFPVTLYTGAACTPCDDARAMLRARGIPFAERTLESEQDSAAFKRLFNETTLPLLTIGAQRLHGYEAGQWRDYLNAAGYPAQSLLPPSYRQEAARPLVAPAPAAAASSAAPVRPPAQSAPAAPARPAPSPANPAGIIF